MCAFAIKKSEDLSWQLKPEEEQPTWTCLSAPLDKEGNIAAGRDYVPLSLGMSTLGKHGADAELIGQLTLSIGLKIPFAAEGQEPNCKLRPTLLRTETSGQLSEVLCHTKFLIELLARGAGTNFLLGLMFCRTI